MLTMNCSTVACGKSPAVAGSKKPVSYGSARSTYSIISNWFLQTGSWPDNIISSSVSFHVCFTSGSSIVTQIRFLCVDLARYRGRHTCIWNKIQNLLFSRARCSEYVFEAPDKLYVLNLPYYFVPATSFRFLPWNTDRHPVRFPRGFLLRLVHAFAAWHSGLW